MSYMQKHWDMNIHEEKMVNMIHLIQLGIIRRDNMYNRAASLSKEEKKAPTHRVLTYLSCWSLHYQDVFLMRVHSFHSDPLQSWVTAGGFSTQHFRLFIFSSCSLCESSLVSGLFSKMSDFFSVKCKECSVLTPQPTHVMPALQSGLYKNQRYNYEQMMQLCKMSLCSFI